MVNENTEIGFHIHFQNDRPEVSARELYTALEVGTLFRQWFPRICQLGFSEGTDYTKVYQKNYNSRTGQIEVDYLISVDMAKHICMLQRTPKGMTFRQYFIDLEKAWNTPEKVMARALQIADRQIEDLQAQCLELSAQAQEQGRLIREIQPKADYLDNILHSESLILITQIAKDYGMSAVRFNTLLKDLGIQYRVRDQWVLYAKYQGMGYTASRTFEIRHTDGSLDTIHQTEWTQKGRRFLYLMLKDHDIIPVVEKQLMEETEKKRRMTDAGRSG